MAIRYGKAQIKTMIEAIDQDHASVEDAALAALEAAEIVLEDRAKFIVAGQLVRSQEKGPLAPSDPDSIKVALGYYSTEGDALRAATSLWHNSSTGDTFATWVLPMFYGTPAEMHAKQKAKYAEAASKAKEKAKEKVKASIIKRREEAEERAKGGKGSCETCKHLSFDHNTSSNGNGQCAIKDCNCPEWKERLK